MIPFGFRRRGLAPVIKQASRSGFAAVALDGRDLAGLIGEERNAKMLVLAIHHSRSHNEQFWMEKCARQLAGLDPTANGALTLASTLASIGNLAEVETLLAGIPAAQQSAELFVQTRAVLNAKQGRLDEALDGFDRLSGGKSGQYPARLVLPTAEEMIRHCPLEYSMAFISRLHTRYPDHILIRSMYVRCLVYRGDIERARDLAAIPAHLLVLAPEYERRQMHEAAALVLTLPGWNNELFEFARDVLIEDPTHWAIYRVASEAAGNCRGIEYDQIIGRLPAAHARTAGAIGVLCRWKIAKGRPDEAKALIDDLRELSASSFLSAKLYFNIHHASAADVKDAFDHCMKCG